MIAARAFVDFVRWASSFSARSARKKTSRGDSCIADMDVDGRCCGVGASESVGGGDGPWSTRPGYLIPGESMAFERKLGIGREDGAGEAWNVAPAKAVAELVFESPVFGGVLCPGLTGLGEVETCFGRALFALRGLDFEFDAWISGAGLFEADLSGVLGVPHAKSRGNWSPAAMSFSEA